jgi:4,5-DOPA dioxygenase extradiol
MENKRMPVLFVGHGSPMNAIEDNEFSQVWERTGQSLPKPKAILCVSAHWETFGPQVTAMEQPRTIHDFGGFPRALFEMQYSAPGSPELARRVTQLFAANAVKLDQTWGLDHGTWSVLCRMFPKADIPVVQLSLDHTRDGTFHYNLGAQLGDLRDEGVLVLGSGNIVHNLRMMVWEDTSFNWALDFDARVKQWIVDGEHEPIIHFEKGDKSASLAINSAEHYLPLLYILSLQKSGEPVSFFNEKIWGGSLSMRGLRIG